MVGDNETIDEAVELLQKNWLLLKVIGGLQNYLSCQTKFPQDEKKALLGPIPVWEFGDKIKELVMGMYSHNTLGMPKFFIARHTDGSDKISIKDRKML